MIRKLPVEWNDKLLSCTMEIVNKLNFIFSLCQKISECPCFWLRKCFSPSIILARGTFFASRATYSELIAIVSIKINSTIGIIAFLRLGMNMHVSSLLLNNPSFIILILNVFKAINIYSRNHIVLILLKQSNVLFIIVNYATMDHFEKRIKNHGAGNNFSRVMLPSQNYCWLLMIFLILELDRIACQSKWRATLGFSLSIVEGIFLY